MPDNEIEELLASYRKYLDDGVRAYNNGDLLRARELLRLAGMRLFRVAELSEGDLRQIRTKNAEEIIQKIKAIDAKIEAEAKGEEAGNAARRSFRTDIPAHKADKPADGAAENSRPDASPGAHATAPVAGESDAPPAEEAALTLDDVAGLEEVKQAVRDKMIYPFLNPEIAEEFGQKRGGGILLYGPPGTGKTMIAKAIAGELQAAFFHVLPSDVMSKWVGEPEKNIRDLFAEAGQNDRAVIFFDEIDGLATSREGAADYMRRMVNQLLSEIQGFDQRESAILVLGATNHPNLLDRAMIRPGRFDELIYVPLPDEPAREAIWRIHLGRRKRAGEFDYAALAEISDGYSGAEIEAISDKAASQASKRWREGDKDTKITMDDVREMLALIPPRTSPADLEDLAAWGRRFEGGFDRDEPSDTCDAAPAGLAPPTQPLAPRPQGRQLAELLVSLLVSFPCAKGLGQELTALLAGRSVPEICKRFARAVCKRFGDEGEDLSSTELTVEDFQDDSE